MHVYNQAMCVMPVHLAYLLCPDQLCLHTVHCQVKKYLLEMHELLTIFIFKRWVCCMLEVHWLLDWSVMNFITACDECMCYKMRTYLSSWTETVTVHASLCQWCGRRAKLVD